MPIRFKPFHVSRRNVGDVSASAPRSAVAALAMVTIFKLRSRLAVLCAIFAAPMAMGGWALGLHLTGNIHVVEPSALFRSAQLAGPELGEVIDQFGIRTVINLRGDNKGSSWYDDEIAASKKRGVTHIDVRMSARSRPSVSTLNDLISAMRAAPRPILIHCKDGADRTGLASAIYELLIADRSSDVAEKQLSFRYGHFPWLGSATSAMDREFEAIVAERNLTVSGSDGLGAE